MYVDLTTNAALRRIFMPARCVVVSDPSEGLWEQIKVDVENLSLCLKTYQIVYLYRTSVPKTL